MEKLLELKNITAGYGEVAIIKNISFAIDQGEVLGIVGESGSGKSTLLKAIMQIKQTGIKVFDGKVIYNGRDLETLSEEEKRRIRGEKLGVIFQNPGSSLNPTRKIKKQFIETLTSHKKIDKQKALEEILKIFEKLSLKDGERILNSYPFELSGGMNQRVAIALAMLMDTNLLLCDEPTSALDASVEVKVVEEFKNLNKKFNTSIIIITHNMGVVANMANTIGVMYGGYMLEYGDVDKVLKTPKHPYTKALINSVPKLNGKVPETMDFSKFDYTELEKIYEENKEKLMDNPFKLIEIDEKHMVSLIKIKR